MCFAIRGLVALFSSPSWVAPQTRHHHRARSLVGPTRTFARYLDRGHYTAIGMIDAKGKQTPQVLVVERGRRIRSDEREMLGSSNWACLYFAPRSGRVQAVTNATPYEIFTNGSSARSQPRAAPVCEGAARLSR